MRGRSTAIALASALIVLAPADPALADDFVLQARKAASPPELDGEVTDEEWAGASIAGRFIQFEPQRGQPSPVRTEALVLYDSTHLYVACRVWDDQPITAQLTQRDAELLRDDAVTVVVDSFHDRRTGYYFTANALGTQADGRVADDGRNVDENWDAT